MQGIPSMVFLPSGCLGRHPDWLEGTGHRDVRERILDAEGIRNLSANPLIAVGSHCRTHRNLTSLEEGEALREIRDSKSELECILGRGSARSASRSALMKTDTWHSPSSRIRGMFRHFAGTVPRRRTDHRPCPGRSGRLAAGIPPEDDRAYRWMAPVSAMKRKWRKAIVGFLPSFSSNVSRDRSVR